MKRKPRIYSIVAARPNFVKISPILAEVDKRGTLDAVLVHTGQHYDAAMKRSFFDQLQIPEPEIDLEVGSGSHAQQTADIMKRFEPVLDEKPPVAVLVVGFVGAIVGTRWLCREPSERLVVGLLLMLLSRRFEFPGLFCTLVS